MRSNWGWDTDHNGPAGHRETSGGYSGCSETGVIRLDLYLYNLLGFQSEQCVWVGWGEEGHLSALQDESGFREVEVWLSREGRGSGMA